MVQGVAIEQGKIVPQRVGKGMAKSTLTTCAKLLSRRTSNQNKRARELLFICYFFSDLAMGFVVDRAPRAPACAASSDALPGCTVAPRRWT